jgi:gliding motility-associated-like protein
LANIFTYRSWIRKLVRLSFVLPLFLGQIIQLEAQTTVKMSNGKVVSCKGKLTDSEDNQQSPQKYANNEDYTLTVCVKGASTIDIKFNSAFCTETTSDYLKVFKGRDTFGTLIRTYTGSINNPSPITVSDTCVTFYFHSDANIVCDGWDLDWEAKITSVPQPIFNTLANPTCNSNKIRVTLDQKFHCDSVKASNFKLSGALSTGISNVQAIGCDANNETNTFDITFASGLNKSGNYLLNFNSSFKDACDSLWKINAKLNFKITDCPILVNLTSTRYVICKGSCARLRSTVTGGNSSNYAYNWISGGLTGAPPKTVCPTSDTRYILEVTDGVSVPGRDTVDVVVLDPPVAQNDTVVCQSSGSFDLSATPSGGTWSGTGIIDPNAGTFDPSVSKGGVFVIYYYVGTCSDSVQVTVRGINAGIPNAACVGTAPFMVTNFSPAGGTWSGPNISSTGIFTPPSSSGSFVVTYTWNGCSSNKTINIDGIVIKHFDTICKSVANDTFSFSPKGGFWSGPGILKYWLGTNSPNTAGAGNKQYIYALNGCSDTLRRTIEDVDARYNEIACPDGGLRTLPAGLPAGGFWTGKGMLDSFAGIFDPDSFSVPGKSTFASSILTYHALNGCTDDKIMYLRYTRFYRDTVKNCVSDTAYFMRNPYLANDPWNMYFTGSPGIVGSSLYQQKFNPALAGRGSMNQIIGDANGCKDTLIIEVYPRANIQKDTVFCIADDPYVLFNGHSNGTFSGKGITNANTGLFSPSKAGKGLHFIYFNLPGKCEDTIRITVNALPTVSLNGLGSVYCFRDTIIPLTVSPLGGTWTGPGLQGNDFNPSIAGSGFHTITYQVGTGKCINKVTRNVEVKDTLRLFLSSDKDSICPQTPVNLSSSVNGGTGTYTIRWNTGDFNVQNIFAQPKNTQTFRVVVHDGCSDSVVRTQEVFVYPSMHGTIQTSPIQCYGNQGFANLTMQGVGPYTYAWNTIPPQTTAQIIAPVATTYKVRVTNSKTKCTYDTTATIPGYPKIRAFFNVSPAGQCIYSNNANIQIINLSEGGTEGYWQYGDGKFDVYNPSLNPSHNYQGDTDSYTITLYIRNVGGCTDSFKNTICVLDTITLFIPTAFSPNDDEINDVFRIESGSITTAHMEIFNRWGELVYQTDNPKKGWDGMYKGKLCPTDYFVYVIKYKGKKTPWKYQRGYFYLIR